MTEKRFTLVKCIENRWGIIDYLLEDIDQLIITHMSKHSLLYIVNVLNQLNDENEQLKQSQRSILREFEKGTKKIQKLAKENEQLKQSYQDLQENYSICANKTIRQGEYLTKLQKENEELRQEIEKLQNNDILTELQTKCDKKQKHIILLENKIHRMREEIKRLRYGDYK